MRRQPDFIHEFVPGTSNRTLLLLHGTGGNERDLIALGRELDPNAALLSPRGKVLENGMPRFFRRLPAGVFDWEDLQHRTNELADFVTAAAQHYGFANDNLVAVGYSNGANIAASFTLICDTPVATGRLRLPKNIPRHIRDCSCTTTSNRIWSKSAFSNHEETSAARRGLRVCLNIAGCIANRSGSQPNSGLAKLMSWSGARRGKKCSNGKHRSRNGSSGAN